MLNDCAIRKAYSGLFRIKGLTNNCDYITDGKRAFIESKKDIPAGAEILVDYGGDYWKTIRENVKLWAKEAKEALKKNHRSNGNAKKKSVSKKTTRKKRVAA